MEYTKTEKHISNVRHGDKILHNGELKTLTDSNIKHCPFEGISIWGDSYHSGYKPVIVLTDLKCGNISELEKILTETP